MSVSWTKEQQKVIDLRDRNILVSAAAGSGKTAVLVERIITMLMDEDHPADVDKLLVVTFTEAAAAEMKERVLAAIEKKLVDYPENEHLRQQATLIHSAMITTIHSFCLSVIKEHFHEIDLDPGFRVGEEGEIKLLIHDVAGEVLEENYQNADERFLSFVEAYAGGRDDRKIEELVLKLYEFSRSYPDAEGWLSGCVDAYRISSEEELEDSSYMKLVKELTARYLKEARELLLEGLKVCSEADGPAVYQETLETDLRQIEILSDADGYSALYELLNGLAWARLKPMRDKAVSEEKASFVKMMRDEVKGIIKELKGQFFSQDINSILEDMSLIRPAIEELAGLVLKFARLFEERKRIRNIIDFGDMEQYALRILTEKRDGKLVPSAAAREYQKKYAEIMIDEYQDSNLIQEAVLTSVSTVSCGRNNIFMVGDVKQSIYRFRLSRPELFMEKFHTYVTDDGACQRIDLHKNFRSRPEVLSGVNAIFRKIMMPELGGVAYDAESALYPGAQYESCGMEGQNRTEVLLIRTDTEECQGAGAVQERKLEARAIAEKIRRLVDAQIVLDAKTRQYRKARYSDMVILIRSIKGTGDIFTEVLNDEGIPTYAGTKEGYFETREIGVLLDYLRVLNNRKQDIPLASVLTSCLCGLTDEELARIASAYRELPFHEAVASYANEEEDYEKDKTVKEKLISFFDILNSFREIVPYTPMHELLFQILDKTGYRDYVSAMPGGEQRQANIEMLIERARIFESTSYKGLFHFVRYISQLKKYDVDYGEAELADEQSDTVRIMTIHKSKGLEFPIVFAAGMGKQFNMQDARSRIILHARMGAGLDAVDAVRRTRSPGLVKKVMQKMEVLDTLGEELRVLYVALTRAKEKLIITGTVKNPDKKAAACEIAARYPEKMPYSILSRASSYLDWILPALAGAEEDAAIGVKVITPEDIVQTQTKELLEDRITKMVLDLWDTEAVNDCRMKQHIEEQFSYRYPYEESQMKKLKFTVSELKKRAYMEEEAGQLLYEDEEIIPLIPRFLQKEEEAAGASRGTAYHRLLELLDFTKDYNAESLEEEVQALARQSRLLPEMASAVRREDILDFLDSRTGKRMKDAACRKALYKEQPFVLGVDAAQLYPDEPVGEQVLVQGIIDVYFEEDGLVVLDYKTDHVRTGRELKDKYHAQLDYYAKALEQLTGKQVKEKIIYSFALKEEILV